MNAAIEARPLTAPRGWVKWAGRVVSALPVAMLVFSATLKLSRSPQFVDTFVNKLGYPDASIQRIGILELACAALYVIPQSAVLGALLLTGYLGGAIATHVRVGEPFAFPLVLGVLVWLGLWIREPRLRALVPRRA